MKNDFIEHMNEVISNAQSGEGKTMIFKVVNLDSSIRIQTTHNGYLYDSPDQGLQSLDLVFLIQSLENFFLMSEVAS